MAVPNFSAHDFDILFVTPSMKETSLPTSQNEQLCCAVGLLESVEQQAANNDDELLA